MPTDKRARERRYRRLRSTGLAQRVKVLVRTGFIRPADD